MYSKEEKREKEAFFHKEKREKGLYLFKCPLSYYN